MRIVIAIFVMLACWACRERFEDTPRLKQAREIAKKGQASSSSARRATTPPKNLKAALKGGKLIFSDGFDRDSLGSLWQANTKHWRLQRGEVINHFAENKGLWLLKKLPKGDVRIEFDARSDKFIKKGRNGKKQEVFPGDLKCEAFTKEPKHQTGYVFIFGGWNNRINRIARLEEHGNGPGALVIDGKSVKVKNSHTYRMKVIRVGQTLAWYADDTYLVHYTDPKLITGDYFGFNNWQSRLTFDNVAIYSLDKPKPSKAASPPPKARSNK